MLRRTMTTIVALSLTAASAFLGFRNDSPWPIVCLLLIILVLCFIETIRFTEGGIVAKIFLLFASIMTAYPIVTSDPAYRFFTTDSFVIVPLSSVLLMMLGILSLLLSFAFCMYKSDFRTSAAKVGWFAMQYLYYGLFAGIILRMLIAPTYLIFDSSRYLGSESHYVDAGIYFFLATLLTAKFTDIGAYIGGSYFGKLILGGKKMSPRISPKKTYTGLMFGLLSSSSIGFLALWYNPFVSVHPIIAIPFGLIVGLAAVGGDLFESLVKRSFNLKDSGRQLPGIGGWFDLADSVFWAGPVAYSMFLANFALMQ